MKILFFRVYAASLKKDNINFSVTYIFLLAEISLYTILTNKLLFKNTIWSNLRGKWV